MSRFQLKYKETSRKTSRLHFQIFVLHYFIFIVKRDVPYNFHVNITIYEIGNILLL